MGKIKILIADDHPAFREGLSRLLNEEDDLEVVATSADGSEAISLATKYEPDVAVVDVAMPNVDGIMATKRLKELSPNLSVIMISAYDDESYVSAALRAGADGYLMKNVPLSIIANGIRRVHAGEVVFSKKTVGSLLNQAIDYHKQDSSNLHDIHVRELEVLKLAASGKSDKEIALELGISPRTVHTHLVNLFHKLEVRSRTQAVIQALRMELISLEDI